MCALKKSASASISELVSRDDITNIYKSQSNEKKAIVFLMNKASHVSFLTEIIDFVKLEPSNWNFSKLESIAKTKHKRKISRIEFTEHLIRILAHLKENFVLVEKSEYDEMRKLYDKMLAKRDKSKKKRKARAKKKTSASKERDEINKMLDKAVVDNTKEQTRRAKLSESEQYELALDDEQELENAHSER